MLSDFRKSTILIVDDSPENLNALYTMLEDQYTLFAAKNGKAALRIMEKVTPDLVLLDVVMPDMDGFEVLSRIKADRMNANIPVIFITSDTGSFSEARGLLLGAVDYVVKPYNPDIVSIKVRNQLENKMYRDNLENMVEQRTKELLATQNAVILGMSLMAESRDMETGEHLQRIQKIVAIIAGAIHRDYPEVLTRPECNRLVMLSPLHDIGKVAVSDNILLKPGRLTPEEFEIIKVHTVNGADILRKTQTLLHNGAAVLDDAVQIAESHHEKFDGTGYPHGLSGDEIPLFARIVAIADVYDALTSKRNYKEAFPHERAMDIIVNGDGRTMPSHFDPLVLSIFKENQRELSAL